jgi:phage terminase large subunit-like protein
MSNASPIVHISSPMKHLHRTILAGQLRHGGHEVLAWHANSVVARYDQNGNIAPRKPDLARDSHRIDGFCAMLTALSRGMIEEELWADVSVSSVSA